MKPEQLNFTYDGSVQNIMAFDRKLLNKEIKYLVDGKQISQNKKDSVIIKNKFSLKQIFCRHKYNPLTLTWHEDGEFKLQIYKECKKCGKIKRVKK